MPTTPNLGLHYPAAGGPPDGPGAFYQLASDVDGLIQYGNWTPAVNGYAVQEYKNNRFVRIGTMVFATASVLVTGPINPNVSVTLPFPASGLPGINIPVGEVDFTSAGDGYGIWRGRVIARNDQPTLGLTLVDIVATGHNNQIGLGPVDPLHNAPFGQAAGDFFLLIRLQYGI